MTRLLAVGLHETGHTLGTQADKLGELSGPTEEVNAQASSVYLAGQLVELLSATEAQRIAKLNLLKRPVEAAKLGPTEQHSMSDIVIIDEHLKAGTIYVTTDDPPVLRFTNVELSQQLSFKVAMKIRLWEKGIPQAFHDQYIGDAHFKDNNAHDEIMRKIKDVEPQWDQTRLEVKACFGLDRMNAIIDRLRPIIMALPRARPMPIVPSDEVYDLLLES